MITKEYPTNIKYTSETVFRFKNELLVLDFIITYYQENSLLIEDFERVDYFYKMSKLDIILDYQPCELGAEHLNFV